MKPLVLVLLLACTLPALGQTRPDPRRAELDNLLGALKAAPSEDAAAALEARIRDVWLRAASPAAVLLIRRGLRDLDNNAADEALADFDAVITLEPELAEAYSRRALARALQGDNAGAIADLEQALLREPRNFPALQGLSRIAESRGDWKNALAAWQKVLEIDPRTPDGQKRLNMLKRKAYGEDT